MRDPLAWRDVRVTVDPTPGGYFGRIQLTPTEHPYYISYHAFERFCERIGFDFRTPEIALNAMGSLLVFAKRAKLFTRNGQAYETWEYNGWEFVIDPSSRGMLTCYPSD